MITILRWLLLPVSLVYGAAVFVRNKLYDFGFFKSNHFDVDTIVIGNLTVGGSGKSPMTEYLVRWLRDKFKIATLSRGYGRKTSGFKLVDSSQDSALSVGDEPLQFKKKFSEITVAVDEDRRNGIEKLSKDHNLILLDDAFQHRKITAKCNILLFDYYSLQKNLPLPLPTGNFRDLMDQSKRADVIVVTKCPEHIPETIKSSILSKISRYTDSPIYFSKIEYGKIESLKKKNSIALHNGLNVLLVTGIANAVPLFEFVKENSHDVSHLNFGDHHHFSDFDYDKIRKAYDKLDKGKSIILTTEKDLQRLDLSKIENLPFYYIQIHISIDDEGQFQRDVINTLSQ